MTRNSLTLRLLEMADAHPHDREALREAARLVVIPYALLAHLDTISGDGQGTRDDIAHWVRVQLGEAKWEDRYAEVTECIHGRALAGPCGGCDAAQVDWVPV